MNKDEANQRHHGSHFLLVFIFFKLTLLNLRLELNSPKLNASTHQLGVPASAISSCAQSPIPTLTPQTNDSFWSTRILDLYSTYQKSTRQKSTNEAANAQTVTRPSRPLPRWLSGGRAGRGRAVSEGWMKGGMPAKMSKGTKEPPGRLDRRGRIAELHCSA